MQQLSSSSSSSGHADSVPHGGGLCRIEGNVELTYVLDILLQDESLHQLQFSRQDFDFATRLFAIMDTESRGLISMTTVKEFVAMRCPVFWRRDEDLRKQQQQGEEHSFSNSNRTYSSSSTSSSSSSSSPTFDEVWASVVQCSQNPRLNRKRLDGKSLQVIYIGVEAWMVFCRFIALAQYLEAKRRFSGRHLQQTMRHRNAPRGSEVVVIDVPPAAPPMPLSADQLANYERTIQKSLPLPELDLDHSLLAAHDLLRRRRHQNSKFRQNHDNNKQRQQQQHSAAYFTNHGRVEIQLFGSSLASRKPLSATSSSSSSSSSGSNAMEFRITYFRNPDNNVANSISSSDIVTVRRSMDDMKWLHDTFTSHKTLGGTLCGRILPPFPGTKSNHHTKEDSALLVSTSEAAIAVAAAGVGKLKKGIKSLWGTYVSTSASTKSTKSSRTATLPDKNYYDPNSPQSHVRQFERYLNYLLEHPALSASFPLNTILKASQSGLVAAKQSLEEHGRTQKEINAQAPNLIDGRALPFWPLGNVSNNNHNNNNNQMNLSWIRTAAQAAIALKVHGVLETSGYQSVSARLQHASLPNYENAQIAKWSDEDSPKQQTRNHSQRYFDDVSKDIDTNFEEGVLHVEDELEHDNNIPDNDEGSGYDLLPLPVPAPERAILNNISSERQKPKEGRYRYGGPTLNDRLLHDENNTSEAFIGDIAVDQNIDKLREVIGSVDSTLSRCLASSAGIGSARRECNELHLGIVQGFDSWEGLRGKFVSQRALLKGVTGMEQAINVFEESDLSIVDDMSWQTALAHSAVSAAEDVRSTVRAARTASNAKAAAIAAADSAQAACEEDTFATMEEARAIQTRASIAKSHAIHAAVVEHEAMTVKRRATMALAHDVKCWNNHRKREVLQMCLAHARSQHEATRRSVDAWSCLRDGFIGSTAFPSTQQRWAPKQSSESSAKNESASVMDDASGTIYDNSSEDDETDSPRLIVPVEHDLLKLPTAFSDPVADVEESAESQTPEMPNLIDMDYFERQLREPETILPLVVASPIPEEGEELGDSINENGSLHSNSIVTQASSHGFKANTDLQHTASNAVASTTTATNTASPTKPNGESDEPEPMTASMQSLVDGLMTWGGQYDTEEDMALPMGMAASIVLEESGVFGSQNNL